MDFSIILASRNRSQLLSNLIRSVQATTANLNRVEVLVGIDDDDREYRALSAQLRSKYPFVKFFIRPRSPWLNRDYLNWLSRDYSKGKYLIICNDDTEFKTPHWDNIVINKLNTYLADKPDGIVYGHLNDALGMSYCCFPLVSKKAHDAIGYSMPPEYPSWNADIFLWDVYNRVGRICHIPEVLVDHISYHTGKRDKDDINHYVRDLNNRGGFSIPSVDAARDRLMRAIRVGYKFNSRSLSLVSPKISVILSGDHPERWENIIYSNGSHEDWEFVIVSPNEMPSQLLNCHRLTYLIDRGSPVRRLCIGAAYAKGKYLTWINDNAVFAQGGIDKLVNSLDISNNHKNIVVAPYLDNNGVVTLPMKLNQKYAPSISVSDWWWDFSSFMMSSYYYNQIGGLDPSFKSCSASLSDLAVRTQRDSAHVELVQDPLLDFSLIKGSDSIDSQDIELYESLSNNPNRISIDLNSWEKTPSE